MTTPARLYLIQREHEGKASDQIESGKAKLDGDLKVYEQLKRMLVHFDLGFEIMPGTGAPDPNPFQQEPLGNTAGG